MNALTRRQAEVLKLVALGRTDKQIARTLDLSDRTVEMHV
jgi:DNA-binding NarL/FixJ family response regulator